MSLVVDSIRTLEKVGYYQPLMSSCNINCLQKNIQMSPEPPRVCLGSFGPLLRNDQVLVGVVEGLLCQFELSIECHMIRFKCLQIYVVRVLERDR